jgi:hypothetical protein
LGCCGNLILVVAVAAALFVVLVRHKAEQRGKRGESGGGVQKGLRSRVAEGSWLTGGDTS